jgi:type VI protein secretion system component VasK
LLEPVRRAVERAVVVPLLEADSARLVEFSRGRGALSEARAQNGLVLNLLLTQPKAADEPTPEGEPWFDKWVDVIATQVGEQWTDLAGDEASTSARRAVENIGRFYATLATSSADLVARRTQVVSRVRSTLLAAHQGDPLVDLLRDPELPRDVRLVDIAGGAVTIFQTSGRVVGPSVAGAFTPEGWNVIKERLEQMTSDREHDANAWVLAVPRSQNRADAPKLRAEYFRRYVDAWRAFLLSLSIREPTSLDDARALIKTLIMQRPLDAVWRNAGKQLLFKDGSLAEVVRAKAKGGLAERIGAARKKLLGDETEGDGAGAATARSTDELSSPEDVGHEFSGFLGFGLTKPTGTDAYGQMLADLSGALGEQGIPDRRKVRSELSALQMKESALISSYNDHGWEAAVLENMLSPPLVGVDSLLKPHGRP